jgi:hypothetical protein
VPINVFVTKDTNKPDPEPVVLMWMNVLRPMEAVMTFV